MWLQCWANHSLTTITWKSSKHRDTKITKTTICTSNIFFPIGVIKLDDVPFPVQTLDSAFGKTFYTLGAQ